MHRRNGAMQDAENLARLTALDEMIARREPFRDFNCLASVGTQRPHWCAISGEPRFDPAGSYLGYCGVGSDVTEKVENQHAHEIQGKTLENILRAIPDGVQLIDKDHTTLAVNDQFYEILGVANRAHLCDAESNTQTLLELAKRGVFRR
jgi:PAS domain-containing protein